MKHILLSAVAAATLLSATSCHCEHDLTPPLPFKIGWIVCTDGEVISFCDYVRSDKTGVAIVYNVNTDFESPIAGYAVYLNDSGTAAFADEIHEQGTSTDLWALDGNENTYALFSDGQSPLATVVFDMWTYGQSAYVPSIAQLKQIHTTLDVINPRIEAIGGDPFSEDPDECWYWSSTEVDGQQDAKAWLFSMQSSAIQETPKTQEHKARAVITLYRK